MYIIFEVLIDCLSEDLLWSESENIDLGVTSCLIGNEDLSATFCQPAPVLVAYTYYIH